jgi:hypothetical protein
VNLHGDSTCHACSVGDCAVAGEAVTMVVGSVRDADWAGGLRGEVSIHASASEYRHAEV